MSKKIFILGHKGMLGNAVLKYFTLHNQYELETTDEYWGNDEFKKILENTDAEIIINCIGAIPQKKPSDQKYIDVNINLPIFLETLGKKIVHPTTDCEFSGNATYPNKYTKQHTRDADDTYGKSKADISKLIENLFENTKMLRVSIIGHELKSNYSFLDWFLNSDNSVNGYANHYWNGITTLEWAKLCLEMIENWDDYPTLNQYGTEPILTKYEILEIVKKIYNKNIIINPINTDKAVNKCLTSEKILQPLEIQLSDLKKFYNK